MPPAPGRHRLPHMQQGDNGKKPSGGWKDRTGTRQERGYGKDWQAVRQAVIARDMALCQPCLSRGIPTPFDQVDHIAPKEEGGENTMDNAQCICRACHKRKTAQEAARGRARARRQGT